MIGPVTERLRELGAKSRRLRARSKQLRAELEQVRLELADLKPVIEAEAVTSLKAGERTGRVAIDADRDPEWVRQVRIKNGLDDV